MKPTRRRVTRGGRHTGVQPNSSKHRRVEMRPSHSIHSGQYRCNAPTNSACALTERDRAPGHEHEDDECHRPNRSDDLPVLQQHALGATMWL